jgi:translation initiation factor 2B subunit (eIF-2B alpha/beta/delta family)
MVDHARPARYGTTNYCNTARHYFKDPSHATNITGLSEMLISTCAVILQTLSHGHTGNLEAFDQYVKETANCLVKKKQLHFSLQL